MDRTDWTRSNQPPGGYEVGTIQRLVITVPFLPPSSNNIYVTNWTRKTRFLTAEAKQFQSRFAEEVVPRYLKEICQLDTSLSVVYEVHWQFFFPREELVNITYGQKGGAKTLYKKMDTNNRVKLICDCLSKAIGIDDSHFFFDGAAKYSSDLVGGVPQVIITLEKSSPSKFGL